MSGSSQFRGHLFADLRGSTAFTERAGNAAGAELVQRFRQLVRDEVAAHEGAEVKTEGDAIYVVFPSASMAVMCGLALLDKAAQATTADPALPLKVGVGVHAGEAVAVAEGGYIGTAVNLAARVCSIAGAGELLVTGTVREIAQASIPVSYVPRGRRRLKGISDPVEVFLVVAQGSVVPARRVDRLAVAGGVALIMAIALAVIAFAAWPRGVASPTGGSGDVPLPTVLEPEVGPLGIGQYATTSFAWPFRFVVAESGWALYRATEDGVGLARESEPRGQLDVTRIDELYMDPCNAGEVISAGSTPEDLYAAIAEVWFLHPLPAQSVVVNTRPGLEFDVDIDDGALAACGNVEVALFRIGEDQFMALSGERIRFTVISVGGAAISAISSAEGWPDLPVPAMETYLDSSARIVRTLEF